MVSSVGSVTNVPYSYLSQLQAVQATPAVSTAASAQTAATAAAATTTPASTTTAQSLVSSLLNGSSAFTPEVLSLLQQNSAGSFDPVTTLLGGTSTNDALTSVYANLYATAESASLQAAQTEGTTQANDNAPASSDSNPIDSLINAQTQASIAYNQTNQQNAQNIINANSYGADGVTPLVA